MRTLGATKVLIDLAEALERIGWECDLVGPEEVRARLGHDGGATYAEKLQLLLRSIGDRYDVIDVFHDQLPYPRDAFSPRPLLVARSVLLVHHLQRIKLPGPPLFRGALKHLVSTALRRPTINRIVNAADRTIAAADLVNVSNDADKAELTRRGVPPEKVVVLPFGLSRAAREQFDAVAPPPPPGPAVAFVGTFDYRKGAREMPRIIRTITRAIPECRFKLLGLAGLFRTAEHVTSMLPREALPHIELRMGYDPGELPALLADCSIGMFPSHMEGFGLGVLEMLAASLPVVAYDAPGPPMMLPPAYLVPRGDADAMAAKIIRLLRDPIALASARAWARERSQGFAWDAIAAQTSELYLDRLHQRRGAPAAS